ncbi:MAG: AAA family ATPase [Rhodocyclaceae bacterium]|nr:AAA family ATPase [Rhodocyclaceae bacterium]
MNLTDSAALPDQLRMIAALREPRAHPFATGAIELIETHISWVLLAGEHAYKIKKAVGLDFLDYCTLEDRRFFCREELRLNRRTAPDIYLDVVPITGPADEACIDGAGPVIDYAVHMRRFDADAVLSRVLEGEPPPGLARHLADAVARFHLALPASPDADLHGRPEDIQQACAQVCARLTTLVLDAEPLDCVRRLQDWTAAEGHRLETVFAARRRAGYVRECHGDLHCGNVLLRNGQVIPFDGIEFSASLRTIDVIDDLAFLLMDLQARGHPRVAQDCLNRYLEQTGDYAGLAPLHFYWCYRALVRAMVEIMQVAPEGSTHVPAGALHYLDQASRQTRPSRSAIILTRGLSGVGKSSLSRRLCAHIGAVQLRADVIRSQRYGSGSERSPDKYSEAANDATYQALARLTAQVIDAGWPVVADATFLKRRQRDRFQRLAEHLGVPLATIDFHAPHALLRQRIAERVSAGNDPSEADLDVLDHQIAGAEAIAIDEPGLVIPYDASRPLAVANALEAWQPLPALLRRESGNAA